MDLTPGVEISSTPAFGPDGTIYCESQNGWLYAVGERPPAPAWKSISAPASTGMSLVWTKLSNATSCTLFRNTVDDPVSAVPVAALPGTATNFMDAGLAADTTYFYWLRADFSPAPPDTSVVISNRTPPGPVAPGTPALARIVAVARGRIDVDWNRMANVLSWSLRRGVASNAASAVPLGAFGAGTTNASDTGVMDNRLYYYFVRAVNAAGSSAWSAPVSAVSLAADPALSFNPSPGTVVTNGVFTIVNQSQVGPGFLAGYCFRWNQLPSDGATVSDESWTPAYQSSRVIRTNEGVWFLHVASRNQAGVLGPAVDFGPFVCFKQIVKSLNVAADKNRVTPDGIDTAVVSTVGILSNSQPPYGGLTAPKRFYIEVLEGSCRLVCAGTNLGQPFAMSGPDSFSFKVSGTTVDQVRIRVRWEGDPAVESSVTLLVSPAMDIADSRDAVIYDNVVCPSAGDRLDVYLNAAPGEAVTVRIYDVMDRRLIRSIPGAGGQLENVSYDLRTESGNFLPDGTYGVVVQGNGWIKRLKFVVNCRPGR
jgi:hypothetical protein